MNLTNHEMDEKTGLVEAGIHWVAAKTAKIGTLATVGCLSALAFVHLCPAETAQAFQLSTSEGLNGLQVGLAQFSSCVAAATFTFKGIGNQWSPETRQATEALKPLLTEGIQSIKKS